MGDSSPPQILEQGLGRVRRLRKRRRSSTRHQRPPFREFPGPSIPALGPHSGPYGRGRCADQ
jgi:hypothetical protein